MLRARVGRGRLHVIHVNQSKEAALMNRNILSGYARRMQLLLERLDLYQSIENPFS